MRKERVLLRSFGEKLKILRKKEHLTQKAFANNLNVSLDTIKNWEQGYNYPSVDMLVTIAEYFKCDFDFLLGHQKTPNKVYEHISQYTGLSEEKTKELLYYCNTLDSIIPDILDDKRLLFFMDILINTDYSEFEPPEDPSFSTEDLYKADKLDLYNCMINFVNDARRKRGLSKI